MRFTREDFESWIAPDLKRIEACVDEALEEAHVDPAGIGKIFLTGGMSFVPAVRRTFAKRFGSSREEAGEEFLAVVSGLALIGEAPEIERWEGAFALKTARPRA